MKSDSAIKKILSLFLILFICLFPNHRVSIPENPAASHVLTNEASITVEKQYMHSNEVKSMSPTLLPTSTPEPTPEPSATPVPTPTPIPPRPTSTPIPTLEPVPTLTEEMKASMTPDQLERSELAYRILNNPRITLARIHPSGVRDNAFAYNNILDTYFGNTAQRSHYQNAPGGGVILSAEMLNTILLLAEKYTFTISEIAGASHSKTSNHYDGIAFDVGMINGRYASYNALSRSFVSDAKKLGAMTSVVESTCAHIDFK